VDRIPQVDCQIGNLAVGGGGWFGRGEGQRPVVRPCRWAWAGRGANVPEISQGSNSYRPMGQIQQGLEEAQTPVNRYADYRHRSKKKILRWTVPPRPVAGSQPPLLQTTAGSHLRGQLHCLPALIGSRCTPAPTPAKTVAPAAIWHETAACA
jgi:hypothetical protein